VVTRDAVQLHNCLICYILKTTYVDQLIWGCRVLEKVLELKKELIKLSDREEYLYDDEYERLKKVKQEYNALLPRLTADEMEKLDKMFAEWYEQYIYLETIGSMRLPEG